MESIYIPEDVQQQNEVVCFVGCALTCLSDTGVPVADVIGIAMGVGVP